MDGLNMLKFRKGWVIKMGWEIAKRFKMAGEKVKMWQGQDAEGKKIYCVAAESDLLEPTGGLYSQKTAVEVYLDGMEYLK
jgi:hypothetical protein